MADQNNQDPEFPQTDDEMVRAMDALEQQALAKLSGEQAGEPGETESESSPEAPTDPDPTPEPDGVEGAEGDEQGPDDRDPVNKRVHTLLSKNKELADEKTRLEAEVAELRGKARSSQSQDSDLQELQADPALKGLDPKLLRAMHTIADKLSDRKLAGIGVDKLQVLAAERAVERELGMKLTAKQLSLVVDIQRKTGVSAEEAVLLGQRRNPSAFPSVDQRGASNAHYSTRPNGAGSLPKARNPVTDLLNKASKARLGSDKDALMAEAMNESFDRNHGRKK